MNSGHLAEEIKSRIDIVDLISEYVDLKRAGQNFKGLCPFHSEKTPSFMVNPSKQMFHCFGCSKGGDLFAFIMEHESMSFQEALSYLAGKAGVKIEQFRGGPDLNRGLKEGLLAIHKEASDFFTAVLKKSEHALSYLKKRGLDDETVEKFSIGCCTGERDSLFRHLKKKGFPPDHIKASGLVYYGKSTPSAPGGLPDEGAHDFFRDRIMFPISDLQGKTIAFGGRILSSGKNLPKYINSPDSIIFKKGESCYGINIAKSFISRKGYSIIVEGYLDSIICHQYGFGNTVAPLGTALTPGHLKRLKRFSNKVLLLFDGDAAGTSAAKRSLDLIYAEGMIAKVLMLPQGEDPDTFLRKHGADHFRKYLGRAVSPVEFVLKTYGKSKLDGVRHLLSLILASPDPLQRDETLRELSSWSGMDELVLRQELKSVEKKSGGKKDGPLPQERVEGRINKEEQALLSIILSAPGKSAAILNRIDPESIENPTVRGIFAKMKAFPERAHTNGPSGGDLTGMWSGEEQKLLTRFSVNPEIHEEHVDEIIEGCVKTIAMRDLERRIKSAGDAGDLDLLHSLLAEKKRLSRKDLT